MLADPVITGIAARYGRTPAQIVLRWAVQSGSRPPQSVSPGAHGAEPGRSVSPSAARDMAALDGLDRPDPGMPDADSFLALMARSAGAPATAEDEIDRAQDAQARPQEIEFGRPLR